MDQSSVEPVPDQRGWPQRAGEWLAWYGVARIISTIVAALVVALGALWLFRSPPPDVASGLEMATSTPPTTTMPAHTAASPAAGPTTSEPEFVVVHVAGAVRRAGVFELPVGARVGDAVDAAGGPRSRADVSLLNLAAPLVDGSRIEVPRIGDEVAVVVVPTTASADDGLAAPIDVNRASAPELERLPGVGPATAAAIVTERETNGPFVSADDVERVPGIGPARLAALRDLIVT